MSDSFVQTAVALIVFNRPQHVRRLLDALSKVKPPKIYVIGDAPRENRPDDIPLVAEVRSLLETFPWECEVHYNYATSNLGCGKRPASGISWVLEQEESVIILEDDCIPGEDFFRFCDEMLDRYADDERVMMASGDNFIPPGKRRGRHSYHFSKYHHIWGWATWRRAWTKFDFEAGGLPEFLDSGTFRGLCANWIERIYWRHVFKDLLARGWAHIWDYQWLYAIWKNRGVSVHPSVNLISNVGIGVDATHTTGDSVMNHLTPERMEFPLKHPTQVVRDKAIERQERSKIIKVHRLIRELWRGRHE